MKNRFNWPERPCPGLNGPVLVVCDHGRRPERGYPAEFTLLFRYEEITCYVQNLSTSFLHDSYYVTYFQLVGFPLSHGNSWQLLCSFTS